MYPPLRPHLEDELASVKKAALDLIRGGIPYEEDAANWLKDQIRPGRHPRGWYGTTGALSHMGDEGFAYVVSLLDDPERLPSAIGGLWTAPIEKLRTVLPRLQKLIEDEEEDERDKSDALRLLYRLRGDYEELLPVLTQALEDQPYSVRISALHALEWMGARAAPAIDAVLVALSDPDGRIVRYATEVLAAAKQAPEKVLPALRAAMKGEVGLHAGLALGAFGTAAIPYLQDALDQDDEHTAYCALFGVGVLGPKAAPLADRVVALLDAVDDDVRVQAARALGKMGPAGGTGVQGILGLLHDGTLTVAQAAPILMALGKPAEDALLVELGGRGDRVRRRRVLEILSLFQGRTAFALDALAPYLKDSGADTRLLAAQAVLAALEPPLDALASRPWEDVALRTKVLELIEPLRSDPDEAIRAKVTGALERLDGRTR